MHGVAVNPRRVAFAPRSAQQFAIAASNTVESRVFR
jgi:hypothetical protein